MSEISPSICTLRQPNGRDKVDILPTESGFEVKGKWSLAFADVREVNLSLNLGGEDDVSHYLCRIWPGTGRYIALRANVGDADDRSNYLFWIDFLHGGLRERGLRPKYSSGMRSQVGYVLILALFALMFLGIGAGVIYAMATKGAVALGVIFLAMVVGVWLGMYWLTRTYAKPRMYDPRAIPRNLIPGRDIVI